MPSSYALRATWRNGLLRDTGGAYAPWRPGTPEAVPPSQSPFLLRTDSVDGAFVITLAGELDIASAPRLRDALGEAIRDGHPRVVVDLGEITFIDSMGLAALLNGLRRLTRAEATLSIVAVHPDVLRTFRLTRLDSTFSLYDSLDAALSREG